MEGDLISEKIHFVWREDKLGVPGAESVEWVMVVAHPVSRELAEAMALLLEFENPGILFVVSASQPKTFNF
jgi:hypothetical protein